MAVLAVLAGAYGGDRRPSGIVSVGYAVGPSVVVAAVVLFALGLGLRGLLDACGRRFQLALGGVNRFLSRRREYRD